MISPNILIIRNENDINKLNFRLFEEYPEYKQLFPFGDVADDELKENMKFKVHCSTVVYSLGQIVDHLDNSELVLAMLDKLALNHIKHKAPPKGFLVSVHMKLYCKSYR